MSVGKLTCFFGNSVKKKGEREREIPIKSWIEREGAPIQKTK